MSKLVISNIHTRQEFSRLLESNPGLVIVKFGAPWCKPCWAIQRDLDLFFASMPETVVCANLNIDESSDLYSALKQKRMVRGIPCILVYAMGNVSLVPDDAITGSVGLTAFFARVVARLSLAT